MSNENEIKTRLLRIEKNMLESVKKEAASINQSSHSFILTAIEEKVIRARHERFKADKLKKKLEKA